MTGITHIRRIDVICGFTTGDHTVVTTYATSYYVRVINRSRCHRTPGRRKYRMARIALIAAVDMVRGFTACCRAIVAIDAVSDKVGVIRGTATAAGRREPGRGTMANIALFRRRYM
jgi:hypothetical protein